jgi:protease I
MALSNTRVAILVEESYQELEIWYPLFRLREAGVNVTLVGTGTRETYPSKLGYPCKVDKSVADVSASDFDAVIIPGGWAPDFLRRSPAMVQLVADMNQAGKLIAPICHGGWLGCSAQIFRGKRATSFFAIKDDLINAGATWVDEECVVDANLITARKPDDLPVFVKTILDYLAR